MVTARGKTAMVDHFDVDVELETFLEERGKLDQLAAVRHVSSLARLGAVRQGPPLGLGHAVYITRDLVGDQPFAVVLGDDVIDATPPAVRQVIDVFDQVGGPVLAVERVPMDQISRYGVVRAEPLGDGIYRITDLVEKPAREQAPSDLAIMGRYVLTPDIFPVLADVREDRTGQIQLTSGLRELLRQRPIYACEVQGVRHDTGNDARLPEGGDVLRDAAWGSARRPGHVPAVGCSNRCRRATTDATPSAGAAACLRPATRASRASWECCCLPVSLLDELLLSEDFDDSVAPPLPDAFSPPLCRLTPLARALLARPFALARPGGVLFFLA